MSVTISFRRVADTPQYDWGVYVNSEHVGYAWKVPGFTYGNKTMWKVSDLTGTFTTDREGSRQSAAEVLQRELERRTTAPEWQSSSTASILTLKHNVRILAAKLSDLMIVEDLTAGEVAKVRQDLEIAAHNLEIALLAQF